MEIKGTCRSSVCGLHTLVKSVEKSSAGCLCLGTGMIQHLPAPFQRWICFLICSTFSWGHIEPLQGLKGNSKKIIINSKHTDTKVAFTKVNLTISHRKVIKWKTRGKIKSLNCILWLRNKIYYHRSKIHLQMASQRKSTGSARQGSGLGCWNTPKS